MRTKLSVILLIPTLTALTLIGLRFAAEAEAAGRLDELSVRVRTEAALARVAHGLQRERDLTVRFVAAGRAGDTRALRVQRGRVDEDLGAFGKALSAAEPDLSESSLRAFTKIEDRLDVLTNLRFASEHSATPPESVLRAYSELISALLEVREQSVATISEPELVRLQLAGTALARIKDQMSVSRALIAEALEVGELGPERKRMLYGSQAEEAAWLLDFRKFATPEQQRGYDDTVTGLLVDTANDISESVLVRAENGRPFAGLDRGRWDEAATYTADLTARVEEALLAAMQQRTDAYADRARTAALRDTVIVLVALLLATVTTVLITRSLVRPLRALRGTALEVAEHRLPAAVRGILADPQGRRPSGVAPVPVRTEEELGQVARAFDAVHGEAVRLAAEQAALRHNINAMFVNLSRRGQELAERQLAVLDRMEAEESDPEILAGLFELDHLATRMRRNSENLLVLTGNDFARPIPGAVSAADVFGAALSEVEDYQRVVLAAVPDIAVRGEAVGDVVHVVSELLENATSGSAADTEVTVVSAVTHSGAWLIDITDNGPGMTQEALDEANSRLVELPEIDVEATRRMGLYVVARLAQRNQIEVRLHSVPEGGLTATVLVPAQLITAQPVDGPGADPVEPGRRPTWLEPAGAARPGPAGPAAPVQEPVSAGPPKRAPVVAGQLPVGEQPPNFDFDQPTERLPVYKDLLTRWFRAVGEGGPVQDEPARPEEPDDPAPAEPGPAAFDVPGSDAGSDDERTVRRRPVPPPVAEASPTPEAAPANTPAPSSSEPTPRHDAIDAPTVANTPALGAAIGVNHGPRPGLHRAGEGVGPFRGELSLVDDAEQAPGGADVELADSLLGLVKQARDLASRGDDEHASERALSRSPEAVRARMASLADGRRRGRQPAQEE